jgi:hypothetical protein
MRKPEICLDPAELLFRRLRKDDVGSKKVKPGSLRLQISVNREKFDPNGTKTPEPPPSPRNGYASITIEKARSAAHDGIRSAVADEPIDGNEAHALIVLYCEHPPGYSKEVESSAEMRRILASRMEIKVEPK